MKDWKTFVIHFLDENNINVYSKPTMDNFPSAMDLFDYISHELTQAIKCEVSINKVLIEYKKNRPDGTYNLFTDVLDLESVDAFCGEVFYKASGYIPRFYTFLMYRRTSDMPLLKLKNTVVTAKPPKLENWIKFIY